MQLHSNTKYKFHQVFHFIISNISYTIDIYRGQFKAQKSIIDYFTFVSFFPQLIAGPIERAKDLIPQLKSFRKVITSEMAESAIFLIFWGLFKKLVFADNLGHLVERCLENIETPGLGITLLLLFLFKFIVILVPTRILLEVRLVYSALI